MTGCECEPLGPGLPFVVGGYPPTPQPLPGANLIVFFRLQTVICRKNFILKELAAGARRRCWARWRGVASLSLI